jgi:hypothetical protein
MISLGDVIPNPCTTSAAIRFTLEHRGDATVALFDSRGQAVATLASGTFDAGEHLVRWDPGDIPSGVYFCRLMSQGSTVTANVIVLGGAR